MSSLDASLHREKREWQVGRFDCQSAGHAPSLPEAWYGICPQHDADGVLLTEPTQLLAEHCWGTDGDAAHT